MPNILIIVLLVIITLLALLFIPQWRLTRAIRQVIRIFQAHNAVSIKNAKTIDELGLRPRGIMEGMLKGRDYKPYALRSLLKSEIVQTTEDGRLYLSEEKLIASGLDRRTSFSR